ncbi:hypothetical protein PU088_004750 [Citrobacter farmeri]|uniref:hypothetical protein n=1 Tax=Citrobacter amalonaticus TaxID=35703 RepID=UPI0009BA897F|nr:hypothetical protein [Citrobacter amalonaticus]EKV5657194.1 hypothetical protein [Citrobacter farmeri]
MLYGASLTTYIPSLNLVVTLVVLTETDFWFSLIISQLLAKAIPVRGARLKKARFLAGFLLFG